MTTDEESTPDLETMTTVLARARAHVAGLAAGRSAVDELLAQRRAEVETGGQTIR